MTILQRNKWVQHSNYIRKLANRREEVLQAQTIGSKTAEMCKRQAMWYVYLKVLKFNHCISRIDTEKDKRASIQKNKEKKKNILQCHAMLDSWNTQVLYYTFQGIELKKRDLPGWHKWTELRRELIRWSRRRGAFHNSFQKLIKTRPALLIFGLYIRKPSYGTLQHYHAQTPDVTAVIISAPSDSFWLNKEINKPISWLPWHALYGCWCRGKRRRGA